MPAHTRYDWVAARDAWEHRGHRTVEQLAHTLGVPPDTLRHHAKREGWAQPVRPYRNAHVHRAITGDVSAWCHQCGRRYLATIVKGVVLDRASHQPHCAERVA